MVEWFIFMIYIIIETKIFRGGKNILIMLDT